jgi:hypothetical protein
MGLCAYIKPSGERCRAQAMTGFEWCYMHNPAMAEKRKKTNSRGGRTGGRSRPKGRMLTIHRTADLMITRLIRAQIEPSVAAVVCQFLNLKVRAISTDMQLDEHLVMAEQLEQLEATLDERERMYGSA